ncbi:hypothetical protein [Sulfobacillus thermosulfidooxidans]|uniref:hypothetical protein n=1 Tax=Sulfobacillus thermosulfidooxidans TaxID=28034 RepID=UPI0006B6379F|nr:hypothetical protein [Sulfobacillus thermosulfidooxidans]
MATLAEELRGARIVRRDALRGLTLAWYGGHGVHAYTDSGYEAAFWNVGDTAQDNASEAEVLDDMEDRIATGEYPWAEGEPPADVRRF